MVREIQGNVSRNVGTGSKFKWKRSAIEMFSQMCHCSAHWASVKADGHHWPTARDQCSSGGHRWDRKSCENTGSCIHPNNAGLKLIKSRKRLEAHALEECDGWTLRLNQVKTPASDWCDDCECGEKATERNDGNARFKTKINSVSPGCPPSDTLL